MSSFFQFGDLSQTFGQAMSSAVGQVVQQQHVVQQSIINEELRVGKYQVAVKEKLAEGGFGLIELVVEPHSQREFALKRCNIDRPEVYKVVQKEINVLQRFRGPYIVNLLDHAIHQKRNSNEALLLMEYYPGGHLLDRLNQRQGHPLPVDSVFRIFGQILLAVNSMHSSVPSIIHRDLKLENILFGADGKVRLCDFGSCSESPIFIRNMSEKEAAEASIQKETTQMYRAPEMADLHMRDVLTEKTDVWALGCIFYSLLYLRHPFQDKGNLAIISGAYSVPASAQVPADAVVFLQRMLDIDPEARPSVSELITQLTELASGRPLPPYTLSEEAQRRRQEREAKNIVRRENKKKVAPAVPVRKGAPPAANSAAAKRLAAKKGEGNVIVSTTHSTTTSVKEENNNNSFAFEAFESNFEDSFKSAASSSAQTTTTTRAVSVAQSAANDFDPFGESAPQSVENDFFSLSHSQSTAHAHAASAAFDPFADDDAAVTTSVTANASVSQSKPRQPSFTATRATASGVPTTTSLSSLFPAAAEDDEHEYRDCDDATQWETQHHHHSQDSFFSLPSASSSHHTQEQQQHAHASTPPPRLPSFTAESFSATKPSATFDDGFGFGGESDAFDPFAAPPPSSSSTAVQRPSFLPSSPSKNVRKPSFEFTPTKTSSMHDDFAPIHGDFDPFAAPTAAPAAAKDFVVSSSHADSAVFDIFDAAPAVVAQRSSFATSSAAAELLDPLPPVVTLQPTPSSSATQSSLLDDVLSPATASMSVSVATSHSAVNSYGLDLLSLDEPSAAPTLQPQSSRNNKPAMRSPDDLLSLYDQAPPAKPAMRSGSTISTAFAPVSSPAAPQNPFAPRASMIMMSQPPAAPRAFYGVSNSGTVNNAVSNKFIVTPTKSGGDPFDSLNILKK